MHEGQYQNMIDHWADTSLYLLLEPSHVVALWLARSPYNLEFVGSNTFSLRELGRDLEQMFNLK